MRKLALLVLVFLLVGCGNGVVEYEEQNYWSFFENFFESYFEVTEVEGICTFRIDRLIRLSLGHDKCEALGAIEVGDVLGIYWNGIVLESYPGQIFWQSIRVASRISDE